MIRQDIFQKVIDGMWAGITDLHGSKCFLKMSDESLDYFQEAQMRAALESVKVLVTWLENAINKQAPRLNVVNEEPEL